ncbi:MAG: hypothetical protein RIC03_19720 [Cyclobacteriaceae bacterium]
MISAIKLEWLKLKNYRVFWVLIMMYLFALTVVAFGGTFFLEWLKSKGLDFKGFDPTMLPLYDFPDIWQNLTWIASFIKILLAYVVIISVNNDLTYNLLRQNIIDGFSKKKYLISKIALIVGLALMSTVALFIAGLINGYMYSQVMSVRYIFDEMEFLAAYALDILVFCSFAFLMSLLIKKAGFVIVALTIYSLMFEPILAFVLENAPFLEDPIWSNMAQFLPINALNKLIAVPFPKYIFEEVVTDIPFIPLVIVLAWETIFVGAIVYILNKSDLK